MVPQEHLLPRWRNALPQHPPSGPSTDNGPPLAPPCRRGSRTTAAQWCASPTGKPLRLHCEWRAARSHRPPSGWTTLLATSPRGTAWGCTACWWAAQVGAGRAEPPAGTQRAANAAAGSCRDRPLASAVLITMPAVAPRMCADTAFCLRSPPVCLAAPPQAWRAPLTSRFGTSTTCRQPSPGCGTASSRRRRPRQCLRCHQFLQPLAAKAHKCQPRLAWERWRLPPRALLRNAPVLKAR